MLEFIDLITLVSLPDCVDPWYISRSLSSPNNALVLSARLIDEPAPILTVPPIPTPPVTTRAPDEALVDSVASLILTGSFNWTSPLNVTGPSNSDSAVLDLPPSTTNLSLTVTSSNTTLNLLGSSPATFGTGTSNDVFSPVSADCFWLPT